MTSSRVILALLLVIIGGMVDWVWNDVGRLSGAVDRMSDRIDNLPAPLILQAAPLIIGKPRVPPIRHIYKKAPTVIDRICNDK